MKKSLYCFLLIFVIIVSVFSGCMYSESPTTVTDDTTTTNITTTLSEEEKLKSQIEDIDNGITNDLKEKYNCSSVVSNGYINFQDLINGLKSNPSDYFYVGTSMLKYALKFDDTYSYTNGEALDKLKQFGFDDADYMFSYTVIRKDSFGKDETHLAYIVVRINETGDAYTYWYVNEEDTMWNVMFYGALDEKCQKNYI